MASGCSFFSIFPLSPKGLDSDEGELAFSGMLLCPDPLV